MQGLFLLLFSALSITAFDGQSAFTYLTAQCNLGTREPGSQGHKAAKAYFEAFLKRQKGKYCRVDFTWKDPRTGKSLSLTNFHIVFPGRTKKRVLLCAHWDTRPWADRDPDPLRRTLPIPGANDGASGVAVLMALCSLLTLRPAEQTVEVVFFDGEDSGRDGHEYFCIGSRHFAKTADPSKYTYAVLLDLVGEKDLRITKEAHSVQSAPWLVRRIFSLAHDQKLDCFVDLPGPAVYDDHIPLIEKGIPAVDLIDFDYPHWHTMADTPDKCSPKSLECVGTLLEALIYGR
jgi:hypothetical protein